RAASARRAAARRRAHPPRRCDHPPPRAARAPTRRRGTSLRRPRSSTQASAKEKAPPLPMSSRREKLDLPGGCLAGIGGVSAYPDAGSLYVSVGSNVKRETTNRVGHDRV